MSEIDKLWQHPNTPPLRVTLMRVPTLAEAFAIAIRSRTDAKGLLIHSGEPLRLPFPGEGANDYKMLEEVAMLWIKEYPP